MLRKFRLSTGRAAALALLLGAATCASAGTYTQSLNVSGLTYTLEDLDANDGITASYNLYQHGHGVSAKSWIPGQLYESTLGVTTFRPKPLDASFDLDGLAAAASNDGTGNRSLSAVMTLDMADHPGWVGISASADISEQLTLSAHSALTISVSYEHVWSYDGELNPEVEGGVSHQLMLRGGVTFWYSGSSGYTVMNWKNGAGSAADTVTLRLENPYDQDVSFSFTSSAHVGMTGMDIYTGPPPVPEPGTLGMLLGGLPLVMLALSRRRHVRQC